MSDDRAKRIDDALASLVDIIIPSNPDEDEVLIDEKHDRALHLARSILKRYGPPEREESESRYWTLSLDITAPLRPQ